MIIAIDAGKNSVKVKTCDTKFKFENLVLQDESMKKPSNESSFEVNLQDKRYVVGDKVSTLKDFTSNKIIESNKVSIYTAIAKTLDENNLEDANIKLITGLPNEHYTNKNEEELSKMLTGDNIQIDLNGVPKQFSITEILILPENYSVDHEESPRTLLIDLGYRNANLNLLEYGDMIQSYMKHSEKGIIELKSRIAEELEAEYKNHFEIDDITDYIVQNGLPHDEKSKVAIERGISKYFKELVNEIESKGIKIATINKIAIRGGGTKLISLKHLEKVFPNHFASDSIIIEGDEYKNVTIFEEVGIQYFGVDVSE